MITALCERPTPDAASARRIERQAQPAERQPADAEKIPTRNAVAKASILAAVDA